MTAARVVWATALLLTLASFSSALDVTVQQSDLGAVVQIDGQLFAEYRTHYKHQPAVWPIIGPTGEQITRSFPIGPLLPSEKDDHPHHHSLWFSHEDVNGHNFWLEPKSNTDKGNVIQHQEFLELSSDHNQATIVTKNHWLAGKELVCQDKRTLVFSANDHARWIDFTIELKALDHPVTFGDIKDGCFSMRVAGSMKANAGGTLVNSEGLKNRKAWGMPATWIDNYGPLKARPLG